MAREQYISVDDPDTRPPRAATGADGFAADTETTCICMPVKYWFFLLAFVHICLLVFSVSSRFYFIFDTVLVVFSLLIVFLPDVFYNFVHFVIQFVFWLIFTICYFVWFTREFSHRQEFRMYLLFSCFIAYSATFTIIYLRLLMAMR